MSNEEDYQKFAKIINVPIEISLLPNKMDKNYYEHIMEVIREKYQQKCIVNYGYIISINKIHRILSDDIGTIIPSAQILVEICCKVFLPKINMKFNACIDIIFTHGIFIHRDKIRILIPMINIENKWKIKKDFSSCFLVHKETNNTLKKGDIINICLVDVRFEKDGYSCIGELTDSG